MYNTNVNKLLFSMLLFFVFGKAYAAGARLAAKYSSDSGIDRFVNGNIMNIETNRRYTVLNQWKNVIIDTKIINLYNGLFIVKDNWQKYIVYNEYYNENILTGFKLNEFASIISINDDFEYSIIQDSNLIIIEILTYSNFGNKYEIRYKIELKFDENSNRLISSNRERFDNGRFLYNYSYYYEYVYDNLGRLESVYRKYNNENILIKSIYYDGIFKTIPRPFLINFETPSHKEIVIYDNNKIKYFMQTRSPEYDRARRKTIEEEEMEQFLLTIEYDSNGNEILQTLYREKSNYFDESIQIYRLENVEYDHNNNWIKQNVYWKNGPMDFRLLEIYTRIIIYR